MSDSVVKIDGALPWSAALEHSFAMKGHAGGTPDPGLVGGLDRAAFSEEVKFSQDPGYY